MRVFITGIAGFIGFHAARRFKKIGAEVTGIDDFNDYYDVRLKKMRCKLLQEMGLEIIEGDICDTPLLRSAVSAFQPTHFLHLAAQAGVRYSITNPSAYTHCNIEGLVAVLETLRLHAHVPLIYASSSSVYGANKKIPFSEKDATDHPANYYGATKKANEVMAYSYHHLYGLKVTGLRFFTVYGPYGRPDMAYYSFTEAIDKGEKLLVYNFGNMQRDFTYIDDIVEGIESALKLSAPCEIFNLGNNRSESILTLIQYIERRLKKKAYLELLPMPPGEIPVTYADISHACQHLQFQPKIPLEEGMAHFIDWWQSQGGKRS